jgi:sugar phosphate isomerase/epimerase
MRFGISTHLYHEHRLDRGHLAQIASYGFEDVELFATRSHFDYRDPEAVEALAGWLAANGLTLRSVHAPVTDQFPTGDAWLPAFSNASADAAKRQAAVDETAAALAVARRIPFDTLVVHVGTPDAKAPAGDNSRTAAGRSVDDICQLAAPLGVKVALEVIPNALSSPSALAAMFERDIDSPVAGVCLDFGHAFLGGDVADAVETVSEHLISTHVHDNHGRTDEHLVPFLGKINWDLALMSMQKIGYDGTYMMELANTGNPAAVLEEARRARQRFEKALTY